MDLQEGLGVYESVCVCGGGGGGCVCVCVGVSVCVLNRREDCHQRCEK